ncbi:F-box protein At4g00755 isoform X2 [Nicotiana tabacum]|uniref:F-box protein At4g00755 isoform X2 n=1 Tax=Nicotiana tabacum TaxID=4097 RepID=A0A1S4DEF7_TOBAC
MTKSISKIAYLWKQFPFLDFSIYAVVLFLSRVFFSFFNPKGFGTLNRSRGLHGSRSMETHIDFVQWLDTDVSLNILMCLNDPADVVRAGSVSRLWHEFVVTNGLSKQLCVGRFPQLSRIARITELDASAAAPKDVGSSNSNWETLKRDHEVYASLLQAIETSKSCRSDCIGYAVSASSTDNYPDESIVNTLIPRDRYLNRPSYWSSKGHSDPNAPETLIYKLKADMCVINEVDIQPFEAYFQPGKPIYSAKSVRFRLGYPKSARDESDLLQLPQQQPADDKFIWTYTSEEFPMTQENCFQRFNLPEPVLCIGGYLQIQLLGRVQRQEMDDLFYICLCHVKVVGRPLSPAFDIEVLEPSREFVLKYNRDVFDCMLQSMSNGGHQESNMPPTPSEGFVLDAGLLEYLLQGYQPGVEPMEWDDDDDDDDDDDEMDEVGIL